MQEETRINPDMEKRASEAGRELLELAERVLHRVEVLERDPATDFNAADIAHALALAAGMSLLRSGITEDESALTLEAMQALAGSLVAPFGGGIVVQVGVPQRIQQVGALPANMPLPG